jgi:large subunit ribosomal protein L17
MHRHGYQGRKLGRLRDQRRALLKGLACSLFEHQRIKTTLPKARELRPFAEKLISRARKGGLANRRLVIARLGNIEIGNKLVNEIAPQIQRNSGYLRIVKLVNRRGDNAEMAQIEFVDAIKAVAAAEKPAKSKSVEAKKPATTAVKKPATAVAKAKPAPKKATSTTSRKEKKDV